MALGEYDPKTGTFKPVPVPKPSVIKMDAQPVDSDLEKTGPAGATHDYGSLPKTGTQAYIEEKPENADELRGRGDLGLTDIADFASQSLPKEDGAPFKAAKTARSTASDSRGDMTPPGVPPGMKLGRR